MCWSLRIDILAVQSHREKQYILARNVASCFIFTGYNGRMLIYFFLLMVISRYTYLRYNLIIHICVHILLEVFHIHLLSLYMQNLLSWIFFNHMYFVFVVQICTYTRGVCFLVSSFYMYIIRLGVKIRNPNHFSYMHHIGIHLALD